MTGVSVADDASDSAQAKDRDLRCESHDAEQGCRSRQAIHQPAQRHLLHPRATDRNELAGKIEPVIAMAQRPPKRRWDDKLGLHGLKGEEPPIEGSARFDSSAIMSCC